MLIVGYGLEGKSIHRYLGQHLPNVTVSIADKSLIDENKFVAKPKKVYFGNDYLQDITCFDTVFRSPGIPLKKREFESAKKKGVHISSLSNLFVSLAPGKVIGVTGTKGKSTTASLIAAFLETKFSDVRLVGNIGTPALDALDSANESTYFVAEFSSFQLEDLRYSPQIAVLLDIYPEHLDHHQDFNSYVSAKSNIFRKQQKEDLFFISETARKHIATEEIPGEWHDINVQVKGKEFFQPESLPLAVSATPENLSAAISCASACGVSSEQIHKALTCYTALPHRLEKVCSVRNITFYNDSLATIPQATINALKALSPEVTTLILGGHDRGIDYSELAEEIFNRKEEIRNLVLFPTTGRKIWQCLEEIAKNSDYELGTLPQPFDVNSMPEAVEISLRETPTNKICLLSPASSSLNLFRDYQDRAEQFKNAIEKLAQL